MPERVLNFGALFYMDCIKWINQRRTAACFSPALRGYVDDAKEREQKQADFSAAGKVFLPSTHEIIAGTQPEEENTAARWWVKTPNPNYGKPQAEERQG